jgi:PAS domain S-box-containing protein
MALTKKLLVAFAAQLLVFVALLAVSLNAMDKMLVARQWIRHSREVMGKTDAVEIDLINIETGERGYALTGRETFLDPLNLGIRSFQRDYDALKALTSDNQKQQAALSELNDGYKRWLETDVSRLIALRREVNSGSRNFQSVVDFIDSENGKKQMDSMREILSRIAQTELSLLKERDAKSEDLTRRTKELIIFGGAAGVLIGIIISFLIALNIKRPLAAAVKFAEKTKAGDYSATLPVQRKDEIGVFLSALRSMMDRVNDYTAKLKDQSSLLDLAHDAIFVRDMEGRIVFWNCGAEQTYGWSKDEALGKEPQDLLKARYPEPLEDILETVVTSGRWEGELQHVTSKGVSITLASRWALRRDAHGNPSGFLEINRDVTEHKEADRRIHSYLKKLEESNSVLQDFAFVASHDLQEPLRKLSIYSDRLWSGYAEALGNDGQQYLNKIQEAAMRMRELIESLLVYSRVATQAAPFVSVDLRMLIDEVIRDLDVPIHETGASVEIRDLPTIQADPSQMRQLFQNILGNALKFHMQDRNPVIKIYGVPCWNDLCRIIVEDNGIGFDEKYLDLIFQPFQRLHGKSSSYKGSGMGLAICRKIVQRHNGMIVAKSRQGEGSTFMVTLPRKQLDEFSQEKVAA